LSIEGFNKINESEKLFQSPLKHEDLKLHKEKKESKEKKEKLYQELANNSITNENRLENEAKARKYGEKKAKHENKLILHQQNKLNIKERKDFMKSNNVRKLIKSNKKKHEILQLEYNLKSAQKIKVEASKFVDTLEIEKKRELLVSNVLLRYFNENLNLLIIYLSEKIESGTILHKKTKQRKLIDHSKKKVFL